MIEEGVLPIDLPHIQFTSLEKESIRNLSKSPDLKKRRRCVDYLTVGWHCQRNHKFIIEMCDELIPDRSAYVRWQSLLLLDHFSKTQPQKIWHLVVKWGSVENRDIRTGVACCILENLLGYHFLEYFPKIEKIIESGNRCFVTTLGICWKFDQTEKPENAKRFDALLKKYNYKKT